MRRKLLLALIALSFVPVTGCRPVNREMTKVIFRKGKIKRMSVGYAGGAEYKLTNSTLRETEFAGEISVDDVNVCYQRGLKAQADCIARATSDVLREVEDRTSVDIFIKPRFYLLRLDQVPQILNARIDCEEPNELPVALFAEAGHESCQEILSQNVVWPFMLTHELVEMSLVLPKEHGVVLGDPKWGLLWFGFDITNYTRWFREGFANYAGYLAHQMTSRDKDLAEDQNYPAARAGVLGHPFSSLSKVGKKLFRWRQSSSRKLSKDYYNAALGLFLLIERRFGEQAIREIVLEIRKRDYLDGVDLIEITNQVLNTDIRELAEGFHFPETGLRTKPLTPASIKNEGADVEQGLLVTRVDPDSPADTAGIKNKDVVLQAAGKKVGNNLDFELAISEVMDQEAAELALWRKDKGEFIVTLPLTRGQ